MAYIKILNSDTIVKDSIVNGWTITKIDGTRIFIAQDNPFEKAFENGYLLITDIFGRTIYLNANQCIEMVNMPFTRIEYDGKTEWYEGTPEIRRGYSNSMDIATPLTLKNNKNICG